MNILTPFKISVPSTIDLGIRVSKVIPYISFIPAMHGESTSTAHSAVQRHCKHSAITIWRLVLPGNSWDDFRKEISNPANSVGVFFVAGKNCNTVMDHPAGTEFYIINDTIYKRVTWDGIGVSKKLNGLSAKVNTKDEKNFSYFLMKCDKANKQPLRSAIFDGLETVLSSNKAAS